MEVKLKELRLKKGLSQSELAGLTRINTANLCKIERGFNNPSLTTAKKIADVLGVEVETIFPDLKRREI
jgi:transcriptional regulator with XRE-family HTH domain